jgi:GT2 family glycosyltransferase
VSDLNASIVLYHNSIDEISKTINSFFETSLHVKLFLVDNSSDDRLSILAKGNKHIEYIFNGANFGYGKAHNIALRKSIEEGVRYHLVLNPDVLIHKGTLESLLTYMNEHPPCANIMPQVLYPDGSIQYLCKRLPTPMNLFLRRFVPLKSWKELHARTYELRATKYDSIMNVPSLSGCFMFLRVEALKEIGVFDERYFMYMEDVDLNRRLHVKYETLFYPLASITHGYEKASYKNKKLLWYHICSAWRYFNKWGWCFDRERDAINASSDKLKNKGNF